MQVIPFFNTLGLVSILSFFFVLTLAQDSDSSEIVTLWQFGQGRLLPGQATLPLVPLITASDGSATMYLYEVLNPTVVTTVVDATFTTQTIPIPSSRTIVASASGWVELFGPGDNIACGFIDSTFGECFIGTSTAPANSGAPTPQTVRVGVAASTPSSSPVESVSTSEKQPRSVGPIVGGAVAGSLIFIIGLALCVFLLRRRRQRLRDAEDVLAPRVYNEPAAPEHSRISGKQIPFAPFAAGPHVELALGVHSSDVSQISVASHHPTSYPVLIVRNHERTEQDELPAYPGRPVKS
ncbi:hypothetical protein MSAN_02264400 [Mycena sanguinolenta]|uniref:Transmembrane protein n=1 Tax=Mycena sanguinolenta TaxID=230812 RepID=A0A8H6X9Z5_9AGAR|nr:hypothetical protein MSAN_02264400 [Mycena sanguinolenta]